MAEQERKFWVVLENGHRRQYTVAASFIAFMKKRHERQERRLAEEARS